jgi:steroid delta-isomerase-like uncharacterized protein
MYRFFNSLDEDVAHGLNQGPIQKGIPAFREFMAEMNEYHDEQVLDLVVFESETPVRFAAEFVIQGVYLKSQKGLPHAKGQKYRLPVGAFFEVRDGKISRITNYYNLQDWIKQVQ